MRHSPTRFTRDKAQFFLQGQIIDFVDHAINVIGQGIALCGNAFVKTNEPCCTVYTLSLAGHRKAPCFEGLQ